MRILFFFSLIFFLLVGCHSKNKNTEKHIYYLHGRIIEMQGKDAYSEEFGKYEIDSIVSAIKVENAIVHCEIRNYDVDVRAYATKVSKEIDSLVNSGVKQSDITVIGASKGAIIACNISDMNIHDINYIFLGGNNEYQEKNNDWKFHGKVLCIYDLSDNIAGKDYNYWKQKENFTSKFEQIEIKTNLGHGFLYKPIGDWVIPTKEWIFFQTLGKQ